MRPATAASSATSASRSGVIPGARPESTFAAARSAGWALFACLVSPGEPEGTGAAALPPSDLSQVLAELGRELPYAADLAPLESAVAGLGLGDLARLAAAYGSLFEVGSDGPPVPLRSSLEADNPRAVREEIVRYYDFFGYRLEEELAWQPDHLSVGLEFMHFLAFREDRSEDPAARRALARAQRDFSERHVAPPVGEVRDRLARIAAGSYHTGLFAALGSFVDADLAWLRASVAPVEEV